MLKFALFKALSLRTLAISSAALMLVSSNVKLRVSLSRPDREEREGEERGEGRREGGGSIGGHSNTCTVSSASANRVPVKEDQIRVNIMPE